MSTVHAAGLRRPEQFKEASGYLYLISQIEDCINQAESKLKHVQNSVSHHIRKVINNNKCLSLFYHQRNKTEQHFSTGQQVNYPYIPNRIYHTFFDIPLKLSLIRTIEF